jgi:hypothetical protein
MGWCDMKALLFALLAAFVFLSLCGCTADYLEATGEGVSLYRKAPMNCPVCEGKGFYTLGTQRIRCYHCRGVGLVLGWSSIRPSDEVFAQSHAIDDSELDGSED